MLSIADVVRKHAKPDAWIVDFTNPVGIVTRALLQAGHRAVGLCNVAIGFQRRFAAMLDVDASLVSLDHVGLNHLTWERSVWLDRDGSRVNVLPELLASRIDDISEEVELPAALMAKLQVVPSYYLRYFYAHDEVFQEQLHSTSRAHEVLALEKELLELYADPTQNQKPAALEMRGGAFYSDAAVELIASLRADRGDVQVVNVFNNGTLPFLPDDHVIEVPATVGAAGIVPLAVATVEDDFAGLIGHVAGYERLALDAAINGGRDRVSRALLAHPLVGQYDKAERLADLLIARNRDHLAWA